MSYSVISGAVIDSITESSVRYKCKCDACGLIQGGFTTSAASVVTGAFKCSKCNHPNKVLIKKI